MKNIIIGLLFIISFSCLAKDSLIFATHTRPPLSLYLKEVINEALKPFSISAEVIEMPGSRVITHVNHGFVDGDLARVGNFKEVSDADTSNYLRINESIVLTEVVMITLANKEVVNPPTWESINQGKAAFQRGSKTIRMHIDIESRVAVSSSVQVLEMVAKKRVDSAVMFLSVAKSLLEQYPELKSKLVIQMPAVMSYPLFTYLNKEHVEMISRFEHSLQNLKVNGFMEKTAKKYQITPGEILP